MYIVALLAPNVLASSRTPMLTVRFVLMSTCAGAAMMAKASREGTVS
jgi:hypothetical protein